MANKTGGTCSSCNIKKQSEKGRNKGFESKFIKLATMKYEKLPMDLLTTYRKDYIPRTVKRPALYQADRDYDDPIAGPFKEYLIPAYRWDEEPKPHYTTEHPNEFLKRLVYGNKLMPSYTLDDVPECYCMKMLKKVPIIEPPDKKIVRKSYKDRFKTVYQMDLCRPEDKYVPLNKSLRRVSEHLPDDWDVPLTTQRASYRPLELSKKYVDLSPPKPFKRPDNSRPNEKIRQIMKVRTGDSEYEGVIGNLGSMILREQMHGDVTRKKIANEFEIMRQLQKLK